MLTVKKIICAMTAGIMTLTIAAFQPSNARPAANAAGKTAIEIVDDMGLGWNLGNTFDAWNVGWTSETWTGWGNDMPKESLFAALHAQGFDSVRIPITWYQHIDSSTYDIEDDYLARIKTVVDYARAQDMYVIINMHWDWESGGSLWLNKGEAAIPQFKTMWTEIANYFKDYDEHLVFEDLNEVGWDNPYNYSDNDYKTINAFNAAFVPTIRATGGNNADRLLLLAGANTDLDQTCSDKFVVPDDPMVAVSIHYYRPSTFCVADPGASWGYRADWGTSADINAVYNDFAKMKSVFMDKGIPVILGEYGVANAGKFNKDAESIRKFIRTVASTSQSTTGITCYLWDDSGHGDLSYFDRNNLVWFDDEVGKIINEVSGSSGEGPSFQTKNRVTLKFSDIPFITENDGSQFYKIDLSPYGAQDAKLTSVVINGKVTGGDYVGYGLGFEAYRNGESAAGWAAEKVSLTTAGSASALFDGKSDDENGDYTYELVMKYLQIQQWWADGAATADLTSVTLEFDKEISVIDTGETDPTDAPEQPTDAPEQPTDAPERPTDAPEQPTDAPEQPTDAPEQPTDAPEQPTDGVPQVTLSGDADENGKVNVLDVILVNKSIMVGEPMTAQGKANADVDGSDPSKPDAKDALNILKKVVGLIDLPVQKSE